MLKIKKYIYVWCYFFINVSKYFRMQAYRCKVQKGNGHFYLMFTTKWVIKKGVMDFFKMNE